MNCGNPNCEQYDCNCAKRVKVKHGKIDDHLRTRMEHWRQIWQAVINRDFGEEYRTTMIHAEWLAKESGNTAEKEADAIRATVAKNAQHARKNLRRIEQAIGKR